MMLSTAKVAQDEEIREAQAYRPAIGSCDHIATAMDSLKRIDF